MSVDNGLCSVFSISDSGVEKIHFQFGRIQTHPALSCPAPCSTQIFLPCPAL